MMRPCGSESRPPAPCPPKPAAHQGFLLPRILASGRQWQRHYPLCLEIEGLQELTSPLTLESVHVSGDARWEISPGDNPQLLCLHVRIPLACRVCDGCGRFRTGSTHLCTCVTLRLSLPAAQCWRASLMLLPCVRLACPPCTAECPCFDAVLEFLVDGYLIRWDPCLSGASSPVCPELPLYPQPCFPQPPYPPQRCPQGSRLPC